MVLNVHFQFIVGITSYGYTFYALVARNEQGRGSPLSYCISSEDSGEVVKVFLKSLKTAAENNGFTFCPRYIKFVDQTYFLLQN